MRMSVNSAERYVYSSSNQYVRPYKYYLSLSKPRITSMVTLSSALGYFLAAEGNISWLPFLVAMVGTALSSAGAGALNNYLERDIDKNMRRTARRPLPAGNLSANEALLFGIAAVLSGVALLAVEVNLLSGFLALLTAFLYVLVYTPLKRIHWLNTFVGAIPGAIPPMGGWAAAVGHLDAGAWILFLIMFAWQHPHFYAIAWMYRDDYEKAGFKMLPVVYPDGKATLNQIIFYSSMLLCVSFLLTFIGITGELYLIGAMMLGALMLICGMFLAHSRTVEDARKLLRASVAYLPLLYIFIICDVVIR